jgi:hypothetical protein
MLHLRQSASICGQRRFFLNLPRCKKPSPFETCAHSRGHDFIFPARAAFGEGVASLGFALSIPLQSEKPFEQENAERTEFLLCCLRALLFGLASKKRTVKAGHLISCF